jgi:ribosomal protein S10
MRFHNLSAYKAYVTSFLIHKLNKTDDEKTKTLLSELIQRLAIVRTRDFDRFLRRILEVQKQTGIDLSELIPTPEEVQQIMQYPS